MLGIREGIERQVHQLVGFGSGEVDLDRPAGDPGLFGPASAAWKVHGDFTTMMIGGLAGLLMQMLHPGVLAGVWDHSNFRQDMLGRLRRTAQFIAGTTYGSTAQALALIAKVQVIHDHVQGWTQDGAHYSAHDPDLLAWVHVTETTSFLNAYVRYRAPWFPQSAQDRYFAEMAEIADRLGALHVPKTLADAMAFIEDMRPTLRCDERTRQVARALLVPRSVHLGPLLFQSVTNSAAIDLLPEWAARMHRLPMPRQARPIVRGGAQGMAMALRWALRDGSARRARRRVKGT
ncbi:oxygenase MpaB family protein [Rhizorhapis suberifaciens]|uniref:Uncharacterized protein (DUF2236 family) n=1 Tax=Rhizorhapis suberifaciens TaxID=13656 RepID=A0A840HY42_9SPHN|nr:oxygenase MpaB family protein [Rhizorhapis suberifaciens]MBB4642428.1 uncharacterized protein (DUF2236 family) [Rhizorhapis suberifaciens]